jgi:hypothetical protein
MKILLVDQILDNFVTHCVSQFLHGNSLNGHHRKSFIFWDVTTYTLVVVHRLSEEHAVSIFMVEYMVSNTATTSKQKGDCAEYTSYLLLMYNRPICGRSTGAYTNLGDLQRDLRGLSPTPPNKKKNTCFFMSSL